MSETLADITAALARLADWRALCEWLEAQPYNASYKPRCRGAYLLTGLYSPQRTIRVPDEDAPPLLIGDRAIPLMKDVPNPRLAEEQAIAARARAIVAERRRLKVVFWSTGHGWRLYKDYQTELDQEQQRLEALAAELQKGQA